MTSKRIPPPENEHGYTAEEIKKIFGSNAEAMLNEMKGCTVMKNQKDETLFFRVDVRRAWDIVRKGHSEIPWDQQLFANWHLCQRRGRDFT